MQPLSPQVEVNKSGQRIRNMFANIAPRYDFLNHLLSANIDKSWRRELVARIRLTSNKPILDVCTGTGDLVFEAFDRFASSPIEFLACDFCPEMLTIAKRKQNMPQRRAALDRLRFFEADAMQLPLETGSCQVVMNAFGIRNVSETEIGLSEMIRVCDAGGQVLILEFSKPTAPVLKQLYQGYFRLILPSVGQLISRSRESAYNYLPASVQAFPSGADFVEIMVKLGLKHVRFWPLTLGIATVYEGTK